MLLNELAVKALDRDSFTPLYHQLYEILRAKIESGYWKPGEIMPTEADLNEMFDVSQITIRKALDILVESGLIYRQRGKGTFVAQPAIISNVTHLMNFATDMQMRGHSFSTKVLETGIVEVSKNTAELMQIQVGDELVKIERLRIADNEPLSVEKTFLVHNQCPGILRFNFEQYSLSDVLEKEYKIILTKGNQTIRARNAGDDLAHQLGISPEDPILALERIAYSQNNTPIEFLRIFYRGDRYALHSDLQGK